MHRGEGGIRRDGDKREREREQERERKRESKKERYIDIDNWLLTPSQPHRSDQGDQERDSDRERVCLLKAYSPANRTGSSERACACVCV